MTSLYFVSCLSLYLLLFPERNDHSTFSHCFKYFGYEQTDRIAVNFKNCDKIYTSLKKDSPKNNRNSSISCNKTGNNKKEYLINILLQYIESKQSHKYFLWFVLFLSGGNLFIFSTSFMAFTTIPYSEKIYATAVILWSLCLPIMGIVTHFYPVERLFTLIFSVIIHNVICTSLVYIATLAPECPFLDSTTFSGFIVFLWMAEGILGYLEFASALHCLLKMNIPNAFFCGFIISHIGEFVIGSFFFALINFTNLFEAA